MIGYKVKGRWLYPLKDTWVLKMTLENRSLTLSHPLLSLVDNCWSVIFFVGLVEAFRLKQVPTGG